MLTSFTRARARDTKDRSPTPNDEHRVQIKLATLTQVQALVFDDHVQRESLLRAADAMLMLCGRVVQEGRPFQGIVQPRIIVDVERVKVTAQGSAEKDGILRDDGDARAQSI